MSVTSPAARERVCRPARARRHAETTSRRCRLRAQAPAPGARRSATATRRGPAYQSLFVCLCRGTVTRRKGKRVSKPKQNRHVTGPVRVFTIRGTTCVHECLRRPHPACPARAQYSPAPCGFSCRFNCARTLSNFRKRSFEIVAAFKPRKVAKYSLKCAASRSPDAKASSKPTRASRSGPSAAPILHMSFLASRCLAICRLQT